MIVRESTNADGGARLSLSAARSGRDRAIGTGRPIGGEMT
jgi:hypothetical protein